MSSSAANDYLTKQLFIERNVVTFRSLSRALGIHVNLAKNELAAYHAKPQMPQTSSATYLITGDAKPERTLRNGTDEDVDMDYEDDFDSEEELPLVKNVLVGEADVEAVKSQFTRIHSIYVYSLSPSPIRDSSLICAPTDMVRQRDNKEGAAFGLTVGKIVAPNIQMKKGAVHPPVASTSKSKPGPPVTSKEKALDVKGKAKEMEQVKEKPAQKPKATGKLDWSRAKTKEMKKEDSKENETVKVPSISKNDKVSTASANKPIREEQKRGTKRKSGVSALSDSEDLSEPSRGASSSAQSLPVSRASSMYSIPPSDKSGARVEKGVILSDDEDVPQPASRRKNRSITSSRMSSDIDLEAEQNLKAMMDVDDDQVTRVSRTAPIVARQEEEEEGTDEDVDMTDDPIPLTKPQRKKKVKKVVPIGRNGLKKKRIVKSRMTNDDKGYTMIEDYSEYESVEEEESEPEKPTKGKGKKKSENTRDTTTVATVARKDSMKGHAGKSGKIQAGAKKVVKGQGSLADFFGKPKK